MSVCKQAEHIVIKSEEIYIPHMQTAKIRCFFLKVQCLISGPLVAPNSFVEQQQTATSFFFTIENATTKNWKTL